MDLRFSEAQEILKKAARDFLTTECPKPLVRELEKSEKGCLVSASLSTPIRLEPEITEG